MWRQKYKNKNKGFTIIELLVTIGIIAVLAGIGVVTVSKITGTNNQTQCVNNLRAISQGLQLYYNDYMFFPEDGYPDDADDLYPLSTDLANYITTKSTFICPTDNDPTSTGNFASYDPYYISRKDSYGTDELAIGCPRHRGGNNSTSAFSTGSTEITRVGTVLANGQEIPPDGTTAQRTINSVGDVMKFDDLSTVTVTNASGGSYGCILVQSVRLADGTLYSIIKVQDSGTINVQVTSGSKFEVVTPSAIVGVRGTQFTVQTSNNGIMKGYQTDVTLTSGTVTVLNRETGDTILLTSGGTTIVATGDTALHYHYHAHADGTWHSHGHPSLNNAHHGKLIPGTEGEEESLVNLINQSPPLNSSDLKVDLLAASPLSLTVLIAAIDRSPNMNTTDLKDVLLNETALSDNVLFAAIDRTSPMNSSDLKDVLLDESPLSAEVLQTAIDRDPAMDSGDLQSVLDAQ